MKMQSVDGTGQTLRSSPAVLLPIRALPPDHVGAGRFVLLQGIRCALALLLCASSWLALASEANAPKSVPAPTLAVAGREIIGSGFNLQVPGASWKSSGSTEVMLPAPIMALRLGQGPWLGCGYLESTAAPLSLTVEPKADGVALEYRFAGGGRWQVTVALRGQVVLIDETAAMGLRDAWVFDAFYGWQADAGIALSAGAATGNFLTLPCHYDKDEATILAHRPGPQVPAGLAVLSTGRPEILAVWVREPQAWQHPEELPVTLWQRRQRGNNVKSRHVLGPDVKSDGTPNPRTADLIGTSLYEGHVTLEFPLGTGERRLALTVLERPPERHGILPALAQVMKP